MTTTQLLEFVEHNGKFVVEFGAAPKKNSIKVVMKLEPPATEIGFYFRIEQNLKDDEWCLLAGGGAKDIRKYDREGKLRTMLEWNIHEQLLREDECERRGESSMRAHTFRGEVYKQLELCQKQRLVVETTGPLIYSIDVTVADSPLPHELRRQLEGG